MLSMKIGETEGVSPADSLTSTALTSTGASTSSASPVDTLSAAQLASIGIPSSNRIDIKSYEGLMISTSNSLQQTLQQSTTNNLSRSTDIYKNAILTIQNLLQLESLIDSIAAQMQTLNTQETTDVNNYNTAVSSYNTATSTNSSDQSHITTMNNAITAYTTANTTYSAATTTFNTASTTYNSTIQNLQSQLAAGTITQAQYNTLSAAALSTYNTASSVYNTATTAHNTAITTYNNAVTAYDTYNTSRSSTNAAASAALSSAAATYQSQVDNVENPLIAAINSESQQAGIPPLANNSDTPPAPPTIGALPTPPPATPPPTPGTQLSYTHPAGATSLAAPTAPPTASELISQYLTPVFNSTISSSQSITQLQAIYSAYQQFLFFTLEGGQVSTLPNAYIQRTNSINDSSVPIGGGSGVSLGLISTSTDSPLANRGISNAINNANYSNAVNVPPSTENAILFLNADLLSQSGLAAGPSAQQALGKSLGTASPSLVNVGLGYAFLSQLSNLASLNTNQEAILNILKEANPNANPADLANFASLVGAQSNFSLLQSGVLALSQSLNLPQLPQLLVNSLNNPETPPNQAAALNTSNLNTSNLALNNLLESPSSLAAVSDNLASNQNVSDLQAQIVAQDVAESAAQGNITNQDQLSSALQTSLIQQGLNQKEAIAAANQSADYIAQLIQSSDLQSSLLQQNLQLEQNEQAALNQASQNSTNVALEGQIASQTQTPSTAQQINLAAAETSTVNQANIPTDSSAIRLAVANQAIQRGASPDLASQIVGLLFGSTQVNQEASSPTSVASLLNDQLKIFKQAQLQANVTVAQDNFTSFIQPTFDIFQRNQDILDPGKAYLNYAQTSIQLQGLQMPSNFKKELDFLV